MALPSEEFTNLKVHTQYSICEGAIKITDLGKYCKENKIQSIGLSDSFNLCGALEFSEEISKSGTQPIIGTQINFIFNKVMGKIPIFAQTKKGFSNLTKLSSKSYLDAKETLPPHCNLDELFSHSEDIIVTSGGLDSLLNSLIKKNNTKIVFEPGRSIVGNAGYLISRITYIKQTNSKNFVILDSAMNDLIRPALYGAKHRIVPSKLIRKKISKKHEFVGPICETTDKFLNVANYQKINQGDIVIICDVGAYGMVLSSNYNLRPKPAEILVSKNSAKIITRRQKLNNII